MGAGGIVLARLKTEEEKNVLEKINGIRIIDLVLEKIKKVRGLESILLAVSENGQNDSLPQIASRHGIKIFSGPDDINERLIQAALFSGIDTIVRFAVNTPFTDRRLTEGLLNSHLENRADFSYAKGYPAGILPDVVNLNTLQKIGHSGNRFRYDQYLKNKPPGFRINTLNHQADMEGVKLNVNSLTDATMVKKFFGETRNYDFSFRELIDRLPGILTGLIATASDAAQKRRFNKTLNRLETALKPERMLSMPPHIRIDAHNLCNIRCKTCIQTFDNLSAEKFDAVFSSLPTRNARNFPIFFETGEGRYAKRAKNLGADIVDKIKKFLFPFAESVSFGAFGEPLLNKGIFNIFMDCKKNGINTHLLTNGTLLTKNVMEKLIELDIDGVSISFDGATRKVYEEIRRGADYENVVSSLRLFKTLKEKSKSVSPHLQFDFTAARENVRELPELVDLASELGVGSILVRNRYISDFMDPADSLFYYMKRGRDSIIKAREKAGTLGINFIVSSTIEAIINEANTQEGCDLPWTEAYISSVGGVHLCSCMGIKAAGNVMSQPFARIWNGGDFENIRKSLNGQAPPFPECLYCAMSGKITVNGKPNIKAFISEAHI